MIIVKVLLIVVAAVLLLCAGVTVYTGILLKRRPPTALYGMLTRQAGFLPLSRIPKRQIELLVAVEASTVAVVPVVVIAAAVAARHMRQQASSIMK